MSALSKTACFAGAALVAMSTTAKAEDAPMLALSAVYTADVTGVVQGVRPHAGRYLDNLDLTADLDLERAVGWTGATLHAYALNNNGGAPNDLVGTLQGVDNIEVSDTRLRLFEFWLEQGFGERGSVRAGLYNLNSEFYANESAGLLIGPSFGIGSELAATGPNGPSIFPSTSLGVRGAVNFGEGGYVRAAVLNAKSGVLGDPGGVDFSLDDGVLAISEVGIEGRTRVGFGVWGYSQQQDDIRKLDATGAPVQRRAQGAYFLGEQEIFEREDGRSASAFLRVGASDGHTTPFTGGWQAGVLFNRPIKSRPDSALSIGLQQGVLNSSFRANLRGEGVNPARAESGVELTYSDKLTDRVTIQPDVQWVRHAGGDKDAKDRFVVALRIKVDLSPTVGE